MLSRSTSSTSSDMTVSSKNSKTQSMLRRFLPSLGRRDSTSSSTDERPALPAKTPQQIFAEIMSLNARHGHPSVQAHFVQTRPVSKSKSKTPKQPKPTASSPEYPPAYDAFEEIMRLNARHGHPSAQAHFVR
ncbi:hypothetical protein JCM16303_003425 [Sporobolomyces ruberrimus]